MDIRKFYTLFAKTFRPRRMRVLKTMLPQLGDPGTTVLDLGGTAQWWADVRPGTRRITIVNVDNGLEPAVRAAGYDFICADACRLPFADQQFDVVVSNSVIEHVGNAERQAEFAAEMRRCGRAVYLQTPNFWFPVEPHLVTIGLHWLPIALQRRAIRWFSVWGLVAKPRQAQVDQFIASTRLVRPSEIVAWFPDCQPADERILGAIKSFVVVRR